VKKFLGLVRLLRPANIVTAVSDILAGIALSGFLENTDLPSSFPITLLVLSTIGLYGGGVMFNDVFDAELDRVERPERPIPSGLISKSFAAFVAALLLLTGIVCASLVYKEGLLSASGLLATATAFAAVIYDKWGKHHAFWGPLNMGLCRGLNLLLGISILPTALPKYWFLGIVPVIYIAAITMISRGEVHGGRKRTLSFASLLYAIVLLSILVFSIIKDNFFIALLFVALFGMMIYPSLHKAIHEPVGPRIGKAVKAGVISLIVMNASWAAASGHFLFALVILALLPISLLLSKMFAVT
jgi:4-hydroxybenzoate polyprenyltransferase